MNAPLRLAPTPIFAEPLLRLQDLHMSYALRDGGERLALAGVSLDLPAGEVLALIGSCGSGKSTLAQLAAGLAAPTAGLVAFEGLDIAAAGPRARRGIAILDASPDLPCGRTLRDIVAERRAVCAHGQAPGLELARLFELLDMEADLDRYPDELSEGGRRRAALARALAGNPRLLILDEVTAGLDPEVAGFFLTALTRVNAETGLTILLITHDMTAVTAIAPRVAVLDGGRLVEQGSTARVLARPEHPVTRRFAAAATGATLPPFLAEKLQDEPTPRGRALIRLAFEGVSATRPVLTSVARELGFDLGIVAGSLGAAGGEPYGVLIVAAPCDEPYFTAAVERLEDAELAVEVLGFVA
ncbi:ATP-binding cassette domain-containing protein [Hansschlegelia beijingensis]|uniref:D-methionine transport system ATP-binding protein n=1 Tax=Hansschlegelia beijingensis TaxID=1133344 RepID=A0A7W6D0S8_9HYPH|nr:ATP-binding cassette domain-containing protein [Hansschlegelia beijingensis]MBB3973779.1 D-methionine transport system ATP-binding protein [Hansschlegelia beijingensis]